MHASVHAAELPRLVKHVDDVFLRKVTQLYRQRLPEGKSKSMSGLCVPVHATVPL